MIEFHPAIWIISRSIIYVVTNADIAAIRVMLDERSQLWKDDAQISTLRAIVRLKKKALDEYDVPNLPQNTENQCAKWLTILDNDLEIWSGDLQGIGKAIEILDNDEWPDNLALGLHCFN